MTLSEIRQRAREQTGDQYNLEHEDDRLITSYVNEGQAQLCGRGVPHEGQLEIVRGSARLPFEGLWQVMALTDEEGAERRFEVRRGRLYTGVDGLYIVSFLGAPTPLAGDAEAPEAPGEFHGALADYASWRMLSNGGSEQQARAQFYFARFQMARAPYDRWLDSWLGTRRMRNKWQSEAGG